MEQKEASKNNSALQTAIKNRKKASRLSNISIEKARKLFHEIEIHQIALELQNQELLKTTKRLEAARDQYATLFDFAPVGYLIFNEKGIVKNINLTACKMLELEKLEITGKSISVCLTKGECNKLHIKLKEIFKTGHTDPFDLNIQCPNSGTLTVLMHGSMAPLNYEGDSLCHFTILDVTAERKSKLQKKKSESLLRDIKTINKYLDLAPVIFLLIDKNQKVTLINKKGRNVFGYTDDEVIGKQWFTNFMYPLGTNGDNYTYYNPENNKLLLIPYFECEMVCKNNQKKIVVWRNSTVFDDNGKVLATLCAGEDITSRKKLETNKQEYTDELEEIVKKRTQKLREAVKKERQLNELKSTFISIASHELRTPLTIVLSSTILIEKYLNAKLFENQQKHLDRIKESVKHFTIILDDFLSLDKLERGLLKAEKEHFNLKEFLESSIEEVNGLCKMDQKIHLKFSGTPDILADKKILRNVLINLLSNAIKYSEKDIIVDVVQTSKLFTIEIQDSGIGISKEEQAYLFTRFFRAKNTKDIPGTGLGLNIVKRYVELLGGTIDFRSEENMGSTFSVFLPSCENSKLKKQKN